jgi:hypothetical protein
MSFDDEITAGFTAANDFAGESFVLSTHGGTFKGVFRGDSAEVGFDDLQGHTNEVSNAVSVAKSLFPASAPPVDAILTKVCGSAYNVTSVDSPDASTWDLTLRKING